MGGGSRRSERWRAGARVAARRFFARAKEVLTTEPGERKQDAAEVAGARELASSARRLKGGVVKVAQMTAYFRGRDAVVDPNARAEMVSLWDDLPAMSAEEARRVIVEDLGDPPEKLFGSFDAEPFASASIGQVHGAVGHNGESYAVKVQYPDAAEAIRTDLASSRLARQLAGTSAAATLDDDAVEMLRTAVLGELDYRSEAAAQRSFGDAYRSDPSVVVPAVVDELSSARVLTMERIDGHSIAEVAAGKVAGADRRAEIAAIIFRFAWGSPLVHGLLNADPNPGNYLAMVSEPVRVGFLDFGCTSTIEEKALTNDRRLWRALLNRDPFEGAEEFRIALVELGMVRDASSLNTNLHREWEELVAAPFVAEGGFAWSSDYAAALTETTSLLLRSGGLFLPAEVVLLWRQRIGITAILGTLEPELDFRSMLGELV